MRECGMGKAQRARIGLNFEDFSLTWARNRGRSVGVGVGTGQNMVLRIHGCFRLRIRPADGWTGVHGESPEGRDAGFM